jgi:sigma-B regulation protein RsbU (phosphoserine phosphatase)
VAYDPTTRTLEYSNAGHLPIMLYRSSTESVEALHCEGLPIGIEREAAYETKRYSLAPGDLLIMYTDGIVEAKNHERVEYGWERLEDVVTEHRREEAQEIVDAVAASVDRFTEGEAQFDDQTLLVMKVG